MVTPVAPGNEAAIALGDCSMCGLPRPRGACPHCDNAVCSTFAKVKSPCGLCSRGHSYDGRGPRPTRSA